MRRVLRMLAVVGAVVLAAPVAASAEPIIQPVSVTASAGLPAGYAAPTSLDNIIDQSGLSAPYVSGVTDFDIYTSIATASYSCCYPELGGVAGVPATITFDLGALMAVQSIAVWNQAGGASLLGFDLFGLTSLAGPATLLGSYVMPASSQNFPQPAIVFGFAPNSYQYLQMGITSNYGYSGGTIINEVAFEGAITPVPEPTSLLLFGSGAAALAARARRRKKERVQ